MALRADDLAVFLLVAKQGSFGRAARTLLVSQPTVSDRIARLEREIGVELFERDALGVTLTRAGEHLFPYATRAGSLLQEAADSVHAFADAPRLRIAVHATFAHRVMPAVLSATKDRPRSVTFRDAHSDEIVDMLRDGVVDVGFVVPMARPRGLSFTTLPADKVIAVCQPNHPLANRVVTLSELAEARYHVAFNRWGTQAESFVDALHAAGVRSSQWIECSDSLTALRLAQIHGAIALVPASLVEHDLRSGALHTAIVEAAGKWSLPLVLARRTSDKDPVIDAIEATVVESGKRLVAGRSATRPVIWQTA
ncbi:MAG TPA: LysR family transcriptional regulator [Acidimicrobiales bacterium]|jgi:DNA-binding transcriptional LysR family regulator